MIPKFCSTRPCDNCPFRTDIDFYLPVARVKEILNGLLNDQSFFCHKTTVVDDGGEADRGPKTMECAGAVILLEHLGRPNQAARIAERLGLYDYRTMEMEAPVFKSVSQMLDVYQERNHRYRRLT